MSSSCMGKELPKEKKWGIKDCRARKCPELRKNEDTEFPEDAQERCQVFNTMPGTLPCCIRDMDNLPPEEFLRHCSWHLHEEWEKGVYNRKTPGPKNCPAACPYKISEQGEVFGKSGEERWKKKPGTIWRCAFTGGVLGQGLGGSCPCHVLDNPDQEKQIEAIKQVIFQQHGLPFFRAACDCDGCPDGVIRCKAGDIICPVIKLPFIEIKECPLWRIPAKLLPAPAPKPEQEPDERLARGKAIREEVLENRETMKKMSTRKSSLKEKPAEPEKKRKKKEPEDLICKDCRERNNGHVADHACAWCKEEQEKKGRRAWTTSLQLGTVHLGDMEELGKQIPEQSVDLIFTDPPYVKDLWENAYAELAMLAARVLKPHGFLITYAPQAHLADIIDLLRYSTPKDEGLSFFWIISSLNSGPALKAHKWNAICLHKPILIFQNGGEVKGARRCFADVVRGLKQKKYHPWQQSVHDVLGIIDRFMAPGEILLDPYAGWGTSLIAANLIGVEWVGIEIDPDRQRIAMERLQQQPVDLHAFGIEAPAAECEREQVPEEKDTSKQAAIYDTTGKTVKQIWHDVCDKCEDDCKGEDDPKCLMKRTKGPSRPDPENPITETCIECEVFKDCSTHDPRAGCQNTVKAIKEAQKDRDHGTGGGPQPFVQHCCGTCGHHKGRKTFHDSCPRLGELLFKGGKKSAKVLMDETAATPCEHWTDVPGDLYAGKKPEKESTTVYCDGKDLSPSLGTCPDKCPYKVKEKSSCGFTDQGYLRMESCPTGILQSSPEGQKRQIENAARALARLSAHLPSEDECQCFPCPDGVIRCGIGDKDCPFAKEPFSQLALCPMQNPRRVRQILRERPLKFVNVKDAVKTEEKIPYLGWCNARGCMELDPESHTCITTGKKIEEMTYCPTQHLIGKEQPAEKPNCGGKRPAISRCPDNCPDRSIEKEGGYPQGRCKQTGQKLREMQACPNDPPKKKSASKKSKTKEETP